MQVPLIGANNYPLTAHAPEPGPVDDGKVHAAQGGGGSLVSQHKPDTFTAQAAEAAETAAGKAAPGVENAVKKGIPPLEHAVKVLLHKAGVLIKR